MNTIVEAVVTVLLAIVSVSLLAVLVSPKSRTSQIIQNLASGFGNSLAVATAPVTGEKVDIDTSYVQSGSGGSNRLLSFPSLYSRGDFE